MFFFSLQDSEQCAQGMAAGDGVRIQSGQTHQMGINRVQDDAMVGYVYQRPMEADFNAQSSAFHSKQAPRAWALADEANIDSVSNRISFSNFRKFILQIWWLRSQ